MIFWLTEAQSSKAKPEWCPKAKSGKKKLLTDKESLKN